MTLVGPFDGSDLSKTALARATQFDEVLGEGVFVVTVIPNNAIYARERGWIRDDEPFDKQRIITQLREEVGEINADATYEYIGVSRYAQPGEVASKIRKYARRKDASIVFIGSENAGRFIRTVSSVGGTVASDRHYEVLIIPKPEPSKVPKFEEAVSTDALLD